MYGIIYENDRNVKIIFESRYSIHAVGSGFSWDTITPAIWRNQRQSVILLTYYTESWDQLQWSFSLYVQLLLLSRFIYCLTFKFTTEFLENKWWPDDVFKVCQHGKILLMCSSTHNFLGPQLDGCFSKMCIFWFLRITAVKFLIDDTYYPEITCSILQFVFLYRDNTIYMLRQCCINKL